MRTLFESINNLKRNRFMTVATILSISLILVIFNVLITVNQITKTSVNKLANKINYVVYLQDDTTIEEQNEMKKFIDKFNYTISSEIVTKENALKEIEEKYPTTVEFLSEFEIENPLPVSIKVVTKEIEDHEKLEEEIFKSKYQDSILRSEVKNQYNNTIENIVSNLVKVKQFSLQILLWMIITFITAGGLIIFNALKTTLYTRKNEIQIMQFVGATFRKITMPFIIEGALLGGLSFLLGIGLMLAMIQLLPLQGLENTYFFEIPSITKILILEAVISVSIGILTSLHAVNNYLNSKKIFDA